MDMDMERILRLYTRLKGLRDNLPKGYETNEKYTNEYNSLVDALSTSSGSDLSEYKVPQSEIKPSVTGVIGGVTQYSNDRWTERTLLLTKLDAILSYFSIKYSSDSKHRIGFELPE